MQGYESIGFIVRKNEVEVAGVPFSISIEAKQQVAPRNGQTVAGPEADRALCHNDGQVGPIILSP